MAVTLDSEETQADCPPRAAMPVHSLVLSLVPYDAPSRDATSRNTAPEPQLLVYIRAFSHYAPPRPCRLWCAAHFATQRPQHATGTSSPTVEVPLFTATSSQCSPWYGNQP